MDNGILIRFAILTGLFFTLIFVNLANGKNTTTPTSTPTTTAEVTKSGRTANTVSPRPRPLVTAKTNDEKPTTEKPKNVNVVVSRPNQRPKNRNSTSGVLPRSTRAPQVSTKEITNHNNPQNRTGGKIWRPLNPPRYQNKTTTTPSTTINNFNGVTRPPGTNPAARSNPPNFQNRTSGSMPLPPGSNQPSRGSNTNAPMSNGKNKRTLSNIPSGSNNSTTPNQGHFGPGKAHGSGTMLPRLPGLLMEASVIGNLLERFQELFNNLAEKSELFMKSLRRRYPPFKRMFDGVENMRAKLSRTKRRTLEKLLQNNINEVDYGGYNLTEMSTDDVMRLLDDLDQISEPVRDKLVTFLPNCSDWEIWKMPGNILPAYSEAKFQELASLSQDQLSILCDKLLDDGSSPWNLVTAIRGGLRCQPMRDLSGKKKCKTTISKVMMDIIRVETPPSDWNSSFLHTALQYIGAGVKAEDILLVPDSVVQENKKEISKTELPLPSQKEALITKLTSGFATPTAWPDQLVKDLGKLLENVHLDNLMLIRYKAVEVAANALTEAGINDPVTRTALARSLAKSLTVSPMPDKMADVFPWLKEDRDFMQNLNVTNFMTALQEFGLSLDGISKSEAYQLARRLERFGNLKSLLDSMNSTAMERLMSPYLVPSFSIEFLETLPDTVIEYLKNVTKPIRSMRKARVLARRIKQKLANESRTITPQDVAFVLNGLRLTDVKNLLPMNGNNSNSFMAAPEMLRDLDVPDHFAYHMLKTLMGMKEQMPASSEAKTCDDTIYRLGKLAKHLDVQLVKEMNLLPIASEDELCSFDMDDIELSRSQVYAFVDNIRENLGSIDDSGKRRLKPALIKRLGKLATGLAAEDIEQLPTDTELLTVIESLGKYEDELDSHQIRAIVEKIRDYFDLPNRQTVDEMTEITATQIGRFLQYLNVEFELSKFPGESRPEIMREIGKSSLTKISTPHRQNLLRFALQNTRTPSGSIQDVTKVSILHEHVVDLGRLLCGMTARLLDKMSSTTMNKHIKNMQTCPFKEDVAKALIKKALDSNINRLKSREHLVSMAGLLQYLENSEFDQVDPKELASVTEYILKASNSRDKAWEAVENNGFIRERTINDKQRHKQQKKRLLQRLYEANRQIYGPSDKCEILLKFGDDAAELGSIDGPCADEITTLPKWNRQDARNALQILTNNSIQLNTDVVSQFDEDTIKELSGLMKGLTVGEMAALNLTEETVYFVGSADGYSPQQLRAGVEKVYPNSKASLKSEDLINLCNFACGMTPSEIRSIKDKKAVRNAVRNLGRRQGCSEEQLMAYAEKLSEGLGANVHDWNISDIHAMGHIIGGLTKQQIRKLTRCQLQAIEPFIITSMPSQKVSNFTVEQLKEFSPLQTNAVTSMQRSYMSEPQVAALQGAANSMGGYVFDNGSAQMTSSYSALVCSFIVALLVLTDFDFLRRYGLP